MSDPNRLERLARRVLVHDPIDEGDAEIDVLGRAGGDHVRLPTVTRPNLPSRTVRTWPARCLAMRQARTYEVRPSIACWRDWCIAQAGNAPTAVDLRRHVADIEFTSVRGGGGRFVGLGRDQMRDLGCARDIKAVNRFLQHAVGIGHAFVLPQVLEPKSTWKVSTKRPAVSTSSKMHQSNAPSRRRSGASFSIAARNASRCSGRMRYSMVTSTGPRSASISRERRVRASA